MSVGLFVCVFPRNNLIIEEISFKFNIREFFWNLFTCYCFG